jgi:hypothetical protein
VFLGVSKQAVHKKYAGLLAGLAQDSGSGRRRSRRRTGDMDV